jgi:hypothetical protein
MGVIYFRCISSYYSNLFTIMGPIRFQSVRIKFSTQYLSNYLFCSVFLHSLYISTDGFQKNVSGIYFFHENIKIWTSDFRQREGLFRYVVPTYIPRLMRSAFPHCPMYKAESVELGYTRELYTFLFSQKKL